MSGTSLDGVDGVLVDFAPKRPRVLGHVSAAFPDVLKQELLQLNISGIDELHRAALAANALVRVYADVVAKLLRTCQVDNYQVRALGAHGQTVRHRPKLFDGTGYTLQLNQPALLAELTGIDVVADFRSRDVAAGGQGAPLVPPFHQAFFGHLAGITAVLNIGGIANITVLNSSASQTVIGFDCGPGNALMDAWCMTHTNAPFDSAGAWAASGTVHAPLLKDLLSEPFFFLTPPKSTGRDLFNSPWLQSKLVGHSGVPAQDVQATLAELTAHSCADHLRRFATGFERLIVCGGGALNTHLMGRLQVLLPGCAVDSSNAYGISPLQVEATAFAWLAKQCVERKTASLKSVTGAIGARTLGAIYPA
jgi:anhydro-N-acetylmuramic acid kinase